IWEQAFKTNAVKEYSPRVELHVDRFIENLKATEGKPFDCVPVICNMTFDIMADLGFGKDYGMQLGIGDPSYMGYMHKYMRIIAMTGALPTLSDLVPLLPQHADTKAFQKKGRVMMEERISLGKNRQDIFNHLLSADSESGRKLSHSELDSNAQLIIIAGADTTSSVLSNLFRELALNPEIQERLYQEIMDAKIRNGGTKFDCENTKSLPYLQAVIDESLRLWPPVPAGAQAQTGPSGATVAGRYIPPFTGVRVHHLSMLTDERYFPQGSRFWPERWLGENRQEGVKDIRAFVPFSYGPHVCIGKHLAYNEMRLAVARTVEGFKVTLGEGFCEERYRDEWRDYFTVMIGGIEMVFRPRD
ncbi:cytochrome P450, partial [Pyronema domesticum]